MPIVGDVEIVVTVKGQEPYLSSRGERIEADRATSGNIIDKIGSIG